MKTKNDGPIEVSLMLTLESTLKKKKKKGPETNFNRMLQNRMLQTDKI